MRIAAPQFDALAQAHRARFVAHAVAWLRERHADRLASVDDDAIRELASHALARGEAWSISAPHDVLRLMSFMVRAGPRFDEDPAFAWAHRILAMPVEGTRKLNALLACEREFGPGSAAP